MNQPEPIHLIARVIEILPAVVVNGNHQRQQVVIATPNGKHTFLLAISIWDHKVDTLKVGNTYKFFLSSEPCLTAKGSYINNITAYSIKNQ